MIDSRKAYGIALCEASWFTTFPPDNDTDKEYVNKLIEDLTVYENKNDLESYELRELKAQEDSK